jgi:hypothetical protein
MTTTRTQKITRAATGLFVAGLLAAGSGTALTHTPTTDSPMVRTVAATSALTDYDFHNDQDQAATHETKSQQTREVAGTFQVTDSGTADDIVTDQPGKTLNLGAQSLPFNRTVAAPADTQLLQIHVTSHGPTTCKITFGGKVVASDSGPFGADCVFQTN